MTSVVEKVIQPSKTSCSVQVQFNLESLISISIIDGAKMTLFASVVFNHSAHNGTGRGFSFIFFLSTFCPFVFETHISITILSSLLFGILSSCKPFDKF